MPDVLANRIGDIVERELPSAGRALYSIHG